MTNSNIIDYYFNEDTNQYVPFDQCIQTPFDSWTMTFFLKQISSLSVVLLMGTGKPVMARSVSNTQTITCVQNQKTKEITKKVVPIQKQKVNEKKKDLARIPKTRLGNDG